MPLYDWSCPEGHEFEAFFKMDSKPETCACPECGKQSRPVFTIGGVQGDELPAWARHEHARGCYQSVGEKPIETRSEYKKHLESRGIIETSAKREI